MEDNQPSEKEMDILNEIFVKASKDPQFRKELLDDPESVLDRYDLSSDAKRSIIDAIKGSL